MKMENKNKSGGNKTMNAVEVYKHYGIKEDYKAVASGESKGVDFLVGKKEDIEKLTANMAGFGTEQSQRVTIEYDKDYGYFLVKRTLVGYGASKDTP